MLFHTNSPDKKNMSGIPKGSVNPTIGSKPAQRRPSTMGYALQRPDLVPNRICRGTKAQYAKIEWTATTTTMMAARRYPMAML